MRQVFEGPQGSKGEGHSARQKRVPDSPPAIPHPILDGAGPWGCGVFFHLFIFNWRIIAL